MSKSKSEENRGDSGIYIILRMKVELCLIFRKNDMNECIKDSIKGSQCSHHKKGEGNRGKGYLF